jgi:hypothetical protein
MAACNAEEHTKQQIVHGINDDHPAYIEIGKAGKLKPSGCKIPNKLVACALSVILSISELFIV